MLCQNKGQAMAEFQIDGAPGERPRRYRVPPGGTVEIADGYCEPYVSPSRKVLPPLVTRLHPAMEPLPGQYAPGMSKEVHDAAVPPTAQRQIDTLQAQLAQLQEQMSRMAAVHVPAPERQPVVATPPAGPGEDGGEEEETDPAAGDGDDLEVAALMRQSKADLLGLARELGADAEEKMTKRDLAESILTKRAEMDPED